MNFSGQSLHKQGFSLMSLYILNLECYLFLKYHIWDLPHLQANKLAYHSFVSASRGHDTPGSETKDSLLPIAIAVTSISEFLHHKHSFPQGDDSYTHRGLHSRRGTLCLRNLTFFITGTKHTYFAAKGDVIFIILYCKYTCLCFRERCYVYFPGGALCSREDIISILQTVCYKNILRDSWNKM